ncbi:hypothetical protein PsorP6_009809 [Peronosclerospora sorghi]|uniref:Uncharacterized protein n=1 Tax=Peronosclerospora sorghi TaxID=230839 RepID=A0ACC0W050_9STRA|nr:hypothetical protein PsorP6_009809 [Peronosclerospora sorghi]
MLFMATEDHTNGWLLGRGASSHMTPFRADYISYRNISNPIAVKIADGACLNAVGVGDVKMVTIDGRDIPVTELLFIPNLDRRLISIPKLTSRMLDVMFGHRSFDIMKNGNLWVRVPRHASGLASNSRKLLRVDASKNATDAVNVLLNATAKVDRKEPEKRAPIRFKWLDSLPTYARSDSMASSDSVESYPWSTSTHSDTTFSRSASTLSSGMFSRSASTLSSGTFSRSASTVSTEDEMLRWVDECVREEKPVYYVLEQLEMDQLVGDAFTSAPNFKYYDKYVSDLVLHWVQKDWTLDQVMQFLGVQYLRLDALMEDPNFKYVDEFLKYKVGLRKWFKDGAHVDDVLERLGLDTLDGDELVRHPNYKFYKAFVGKKLKQWASSENDYDLDAVRDNLGLTDLEGYDLETHRNFRFLEKYVKSRRRYLIEHWMKEEVPTVTVWNQLGAKSVPLIHQSTSSSYRLYTEYVMALDRYILDRKNSIVPPELQVQPDFDRGELAAKTKIWSMTRAPQDYVESALGLQDLTWEETQAATTFEYYVKNITNQAGKCGIKSSDKEDRKKTLQHFEDTDGLFHTVFCRVCMRTKRCTRVGFQSVHDKQLLPVVLGKTGQCTYGDARATKKNIL